MSPQLKLQQRDDPLAVGDRRTASALETASASPAPEPAAPPEVAPQATRTRPQRRRPAGERAADVAKGSKLGETPTYDDDRLEQTGWRIYETLVTAVRDRAQELSDAGVPTSAAALAAATLHSRLPKTVEEGTEVLRAFRKASAGRARARRSA
jgi:hypothetical protein